MDLIRSRTCTRPTTGRDRRTGAQGGLPHHRARRDRGADGVSGSGKTTLMNILGCLDRPSSGRYWFDGEDVSRLSSAPGHAPHRRSASSSRTQPPGRTDALDNVMMPMSYSGLNLSRRRVGRAPSCLASVGLADGWSTSRRSSRRQAATRCGRPVAGQCADLPARRRADGNSTRAPARVLQMLQRLNAEEGIPSCS